MNRDHQRICPRCGTSPLADDVRCWNCDYPLPKVGDSTPPATPVEPTCVACDKGDHQHCLGGVCACIHSRDWKRQDEEWSAGDDQPASHLPPAALPAVSGEGERLKEQAAAYRAIALDALACWQGEDEHSDDNQRRNRSARSRATLRHRICAVDDTVRASTPTPGTPR